MGYTNAGKSTLLNTLTDAQVFAEDKLFATLDPTSRAITLDDNRKILLVDTVGFIRKLPHHLIEAFKSTLKKRLWQMCFYTSLMRRGRNGQSNHSRGTSFV